MDLLKCSTSSEFLSSCLHQRQEKNRRYSMRKFAKDLSFSASGLCEVLNGKKRLSEDATQKVISRLKLKSKEADYFSELCSYERCRTLESKSMIQDRIGLKHGQRPTHDLSVDFFKLLADWHHAAILSACELNRNVDPSTLSKMFNVPQYEVAQSLDRLKRLELLQVDSLGKFKAIDKDVMVSTEVPSEALQKFTHQLLQKADESQKEQSNDERVFGTEVFAFDVKDIPKLKELTDEYFEKVIRLAKKGKDKNDVYALGVQAFRLNKKDSV
jgi:uncharacterized protein (TIGR02147 family)